MGIALLGEGIVFPKITTLMLTMIIVLAVAVTALVMLYEEPTLRRKFDGDYENYCRNVHRWIPRLRPFDNPQPLP